MERKRPFCGGKGSHYRQEHHRKKPKFNYRDASYVKERELKNEQIENRRRLLEEEDAQQNQLEAADNCDVEVIDYVGELLEKLPNRKRLENLIDESDSESELSELSNTVSSISDDESSQNYKNKNSLTKGDNKEEIDNVEEEVSNEEDDDDNLEIAEEDIETAKEEEDADTVKDPFSMHLNHDLHKNLLEVVSCEIEITEVTIFKWPTLGNIICEIPNSKNVNKSNKMSTVSVLEKKQYAKHGKVPTIIDTVDWNDLFIKPQIQPNLKKANSINLSSMESITSPLTPLQKEMFSIINNYQDLYYPERRFSNAEEIRFIYCLHTINHLLKTRTKILHHNAKLAKLKNLAAADIPDEYRDQGLFRPKVLIIVPFKNSCLQIVKSLIAILIGEDTGGSVINKNRFMKDFSGNELALPKKNPKPEDYNKTFQGNISDDFKIGISITKKTLKLYTEFYSSDIIICSMLGLRRIIGAKGETESDYDFLASIELLIIDQTELFVMQNWAHMMHIFNHFHLQPKKSNGIDFSRVRSWCINGWSMYYRQTLIFSEVQLPKIVNIFNKNCFNYAGKFKVHNDILVGSISQVVPQVTQMFQKFNVLSHTQSVKDRLDVFVNEILPRYKDSIMNHTLIYVADYYDYVKLRNYLDKEDINFVQINEYSPQNKVARARDMFFHSDAHFLLYSERYHFFNRVRIKGIRHIIFYSLPSIPRFYNELINFMEECYQNPKAGSQNNMTVTSIYTKYDTYILSAIVSTERANKMIASKNAIHTIVTT
ncbi:hypothetical protein M0802_007888 [Mischocyttarus mexicanus]|nr:hypothetical protein M0802_007888 [Mischocyttarus mexicanus]